MASSADTSENLQRISERFNAPDADIIIKSSDNVVFSLHRKYLAATIGAFPMEIEPAGEMTELTEDSSTLELLFQFVYPQRHPSLSDTSYEVIAPLAEAAEKYEVFAAMNICQLRMLNFLPAHAEGIMAYAAKHGYHGIVDLAAPRVVSLPMGDIVRLLPQHLIVPWVIYRQQWHDILLSALASQPNKVDTKCSNCNCDPRCKRCSGHQPAAEQLNFDLSITSLSSIDELASQEKSQNPGNTGTGKIETWLKNIKEKVDSIQKFSTFI